MTVTIAVTGSMAYDYIMSFPGRFSEHILPDRIDVLSVSFLVDSMRRERGGCAGNISYNLALLGQKPMLLATVGQDAPEYVAWLQAQGVDTSNVLQFPNEFTASFFVSTDRENNQIASFYTGAMAKASQISFHKIRDGTIDLAVISPNDPQAMVQYAAECQALGIAYLYDPSQQIPRLSKEDLLNGIAGAKILVVNDYEFEMIKKQTGLRGEEIRAMVEVTIVTEGEAGSTIYTADERVIKIPIAPARRLADPTGTGDAYRSGLLTGIWNGFDWEISGRMGALAATFVLEEHGTQRHHYTLPKFVDRYREVFGDAPELEQLLTGTSDTGDK
jgi:adenosine kinase